MNVDYKWLLIGVAVGYFVLPRAQAAVAARRPKPAAGKS